MQRPQCSSNSKNRGVRYQQIPTSHERDDVTSSVSSGSMAGADGYRRELSEDPEKMNNQTLSPEMIVRTGGVVHRHRRDLPWGIRLIQKFSDHLCPTPSVNRDLW